MQSKLTRSIRVMPWLMGLGVLLSACGGGTDSATPMTETPPVTGSNTGVLTDAAVQGVAYATSSGVSGTTDAQGQFSYNPNDSVSFKLGDVTLGSVSASALVTPLDLSAGSNDKLANLLVLLQSLDDDGNAANGIRIPAAAAAAVSASVDLTQSASAFASSANTALTAAMTAGGITRAATSNAQATAHFLEQSKLLLSSQVWVTQAGTDLLVARFGSQGEVLFGQFGSTGSTDGSVEYGTAAASSVDARGFALTRSMSVDTNGSNGISDGGACDRLQVAGNRLLSHNAPASCVTESTVTFDKAENDPSGIVGVWALGSATELKTQTFVFWANGKYGMIDPIGDTNPSACGGPGVEYGSYTYNASTQEFKVTGVTVDSNGCAGLSDLGGSGLASFTLTVAAGGATATAVWPDGSDTLFRASK
jgi:hypothetical protein